MSGPGEEEFWKFHDETADRLRRKAYRLCAGDAADATDACQETYLKALTHWDTICGLEERSRWAWLMTTLTREVLQMWRAGYRSRETGALEDVPPQQQVTTDLPIPDMVFVIGQLRRVYGAIARLTGRPREVMALHAAGYPCSEIAEILNIEAPTVRVHLRMARAQLAELLGEVEWGGGLPHD
jgi:RNA polymerase sigma factor (sigma-70 family)